MCLADKKPNKIGNTGMNQFGTLYNLYQMCNSGNLPNNFHINKYLFYNMLQDSRQGMIIKNSNIQLCMYSMLLKC